MSYTQSAELLDGRKINIFRRQYPFFHFWRCWDLGQSDMEEATFTQNTALSPMAESL